MRILLPCLAMLVCACSAETADVSSDRDEAASFSTQITVPTPDYGTMLANPPPPSRGGIQVEPSAPAPANAKAIGDEWISRLTARNAVDGYGLSGKSADGPVSMIDVLMTKRQFDAWLDENGWTMPLHISWTFRPEMVRSAVSPAAAPRIRHWPATTRLTGLQHQALLMGRLVVRDGCFFVTTGTGEEKLAWFLAETGLDVDSAGYLILVDRLTGETTARVGEDIVWAGPNGQPMESELAPLRKACGNAPVAEVGNPEAAERFYTVYPHTRPVSAPPPAPPQPPMG